MTNSIILRDWQIRAGERLKAVWVPMTPQPSAGVRNSPFVPSGLEDGHGRELRFPYQPGQVLAVRETWWQDIASENIIYEADWYFQTLGGNGWPIDRDKIQECFTRRPASTMPLSFARYAYHVSTVQARRVCEITEEEALAAGVNPADHLVMRTDETNNYLSPEVCFVSNWEERYNIRYPWATAWAWKIEGEMRGRE